MSESNAVQTAFVRESTEGTTPASNLLEVLLTGGALSAPQTFIRSNQIRTDGQKGPAKRVAQDPAARLDFEWSATAFDELLRGGIRSDSDWSTTVSIAATDIAATSVGNKFTTTVTALTTNVAVGQWVKVAGFLTAANNGWFRVVSVSTYQLVVAGGTLAIEAAGNAVTIKGSYIRNGADLPSYTIQQEFTDLTNRFRVGKGMKISGWNANFNPRSIINAAFNFQGMTCAQAATTAGTGVTAATGGEVMSEVDAVEEVWIDLAAVAWDLTTFRFGVATPTRPRSALGSLSKLGIGLGNLNLTGHLETYLDDDSWSVETDYLAGTKFGLAIAFVDEDGLSYLVEMPRIVLSTEPGSLSGPDADNMYAFDFEAEPGSAQDVTIQICRTNS